MFNLAPGHVLQMMHLKKRVTNRGFKTFLEVGSGTGYLSNVLLKIGLSGVGFDLNREACDVNSACNREYIEAKKYEVNNSDFFAADIADKFDIVISSMVIEHLNTDDLDQYFRKSINLLSDKGLIICFVPGSPKDWGIEDEIAGHVKRYTPRCFFDLGKKHGLDLVDLSGLTFPLSNLLLPVSNTIVKKNEEEKLVLSPLERTVASGYRQVPMKTKFPRWISWFVNEITLLPFYFLQRIFSRHSRSLVLYCELKPLVFRLRQTTSQTSCWIPK